MKEEYLSDLNLKVLSFVFVLLLLLLLNLAI